MFLSKVPVLRQCPLLATQTRNPGESLDFSIDCIASAILCSFALAMPIQNVSQIHGLLHGSLPYVGRNAYCMHVHQPELFITGLPDFPPTSVILFSCSPPTARPDLPITCTPFHHPTFFHENGVFWTTGGRRQCSLLVVRCLECSEECDERRICARVH